MVRAHMPIRHYSWMDKEASHSAQPATVKASANGMAPGNEVAEARAPDVGTADDSAEPESEPASSSSAAVSAPSMDRLGSSIAAPVAPTAEPGAQTASASIATVPSAAPPVARAASASGTAFAAAPEASAPHAEIASARPGKLPPELRSRNIIAMAPLRGSLESLMRQNDKTNADNLERIEDDTDLRQRIASGMLVPVPASDALTVNADLPQDRRYCRPWTATFLRDLANAHRTQFHRPFEVSSAVRTVEYQRRLMRTNGNAAPADGDVASPHLTGATIDIAKRGMTRSELYWMRDRLSELQNAGKIDVEEEFHQACFHITVYKSYVGAGPLHKPQHIVPAPPVNDGADDTSTPVGEPTTGV